jgi:hypothetical protein
MKVKPRSRKGAKDLFWRLGALAVKNSRGQPQRNEDAEIARRIKTLELVDASCPCPKDSMENEGGNW